VPSEPAEQRLRDLERLTDAALSYMPFDQLLEELLDRVVDVLSVDTAAILLLDAEAQELVARAARGIEEEVERGVRIPLGRGFAGRIAAGGKPVHIRDIDHAEVVNPILRDKGIRSLLGVPMLVEGEIIGVLHVGALVEREFSDADEELLQRAADRAALAIRGRLSDRERGLADALQRSLLPTLPRVPGMEMAGRYLPAASAQLGGDWYDAFLLPGGSVGVAIGDVVGRGFHAAAVMGQLRSSLRAYALDERDPSEVLELLSQLLRQIEPGGSATLLYLVLDPASDDVRFASAGHPAPLVVPVDDEAYFLENGRSVPLGAVRHPSYEIHEATLPGGATLVLYTDGVVERSGEPLEEGLARLQQAGEHAETLDIVCDRVLARMLPGGATRDDAALLVVRFAPLGDTVRMQLPADADLIPLMRRVVGRWLGEGGASPTEIAEITLACSEACANAIEHAYSPEDTMFQLEASRQDEQVEFTVRDWGTWRDPRGTNRGRGMLLMEGLMDDVKVSTSKRGTTVRMTKRLEPAGVA
jgi:serine phosphatase RsbU (regulator of sigma subunit)/anti-sigma regulatory factor (Ser/Thr protein kinase)